MKKFFTFVLLVLFCICGYAQTIDPALRQEMSQRSDDEKIKVIVIMKSQYDRQQLGHRAAHYVTRAERREFVVNELKQFAEASQYDLRRALDEMERNDMTTTPKIIWMANAMYFSATKQAINDMAMRRDVALIGLDEEKHVLFDEESTPASNTREITSNVTQVNADQVWNLGYTGQGVVVAVIDSGVNYNHLDLADHLWDGGAEYPHHGYDFYNNDNDPMDDHSHGTHCAGTVCGDGTAGSQTGMAPDATLMCIKVLSSGGNGSAATTCYAMQWAAEQGADLFSMSLGWANSTIAERTLFRNTCAALLDAGVVGAIAAGNEGDMQGSYPIPNNVRAPGSCPPPYMDPIQANNAGDLSCAICVGAVNANDNAANFTSRGPVTWSNTEFADYPYTAGSTTDFGLIRPDVCAPGVDIKSADYSSNTGYSIKSGTSMATPCTAGCISLLLSKNINATPEEICQVLEETAVPLATGKSNTYGYGRIDVLAAINAMSSGPLTLNSFTVNDSQGNNDGKLNAGESVTLSLTLTNESDLALTGATMTLTSESEYVTITDGSESLPRFNVGQTRTISNMFAFTLSNDAPAKRNVQFTGEIFAGGESLGTVRISVMVYGHILRLDEVTVLNDNNGNGSLEPGETANLHILISNVGNDMAASVVGALSTTYSYLTINSNNKSFGSITANNQASVNYSVTLSNSAPQSYTINFDLDLVDAAQKHTNLDFELWRKAITLTSNPAGAGTLSGGGYYGQGQSCTITATPNNGYAFVSWTLDGATVSYLPSYTFEVTGEAEYVANFQAFNNSIFVGNPTSTISYLPSHSFYRYTLSQQIFTAAEMNSGSCDITSVSFFNTSNSSYSRTMTIYMVNTSKSTFENNYDWITVSETNQVFSGSVTRSAGSWTTIYFNTPFHYDGTSNVALIVDDNTGSYSSTYYNRVFATESDQSIFIYSDGTNYDPYSPSSYSGTLPMVKNDVVFGKATYGNIVSVTANPTNGGSVTGGGNCYYGQPITLTATPNEGYVFNNWTKNGQVVSYLSTYNFNVTETATYVANFEQVDGIVIGDAIHTNYSLPTYYYNSLTEQIYTAAEMGGESTDISSVSFFNTTGYSRTRNLSVYLAHTNKTSFESNTDWIAVTENDLVFSGNVTFNANGWTSIYFGDLFEYNGTSNVVLVVEDHSNNYNTSTSFRTFDASGNQTLRIYDYNYGVTYDPTDPSAYTGTLLSVKNQVVFGIPNPIYTVTTTINPVGSGTVSGGEGLYYLGQSCTLTATANSGYGFYYWKENGTIKSYDPVYTFPVTGNIQLEAYFGEPFTITVSANPTVGGTVTGGGEFGYNQQCTLTATPNEGYLFARWTKNGSVVSCMPTYIFSVTADGEYLAQFTEIDGIAIGEPTNSSSYLPTYNYYSLTEQIYMAEEMGNVSNDISSVSFFNTATSTITREMSIYLVNTDKTSFENTNDWIAVTEADQVFNGSVSMTARSWVTIYFNTAFSYDGYSNLALIVDDNSNTYNSYTNCRTFDTDASQAIRIYGSGTDYDPTNPSVYSGTIMTIKNQVVFGIANPQYYVTVSANPTNGGTVSGGGGPYFYGQPITLTATPNEGYVFNSWTKNGEVVSYVTTCTVNVTETANYVANFEQVDGTVIGDGSGTIYYLPSYSYYRYTLSQQIYTADEIGMEAGEISSISFFNTGTTRTRNYTIYMVNTTKSSFANNTDWITVTEEDQVFSGSINMTSGSWTTICFNSIFNYDGTSNIALIVDDNTGSYASPYMSCRVSTTDSNQSIYIYSDNTNYDPFNPTTYSGTLPMVKNQIILGTPQYIYTVSVSVNPSNSGTVSGNAGMFYLGQNCTLTATPNAGYVFYNWSLNGSSVSTSEEYTFPVTGNMSLVANFGTPIAITATASPAEGGTVTGSGNYAQGHTCTLTATAKDKYVFVNWTKNGSVVSWLSTYSFTVGSTAAEYVANFQRVNNGIAIGDATSTSYYLPSYTYDPYCLSQQIYTAEEIGMECDIASVAFFSTTTTIQTRDFSVYLIQTDKNSFTGSYDWITATEADRVFSGNVTVKSRDWTVITFDAPFHYDGTSNLALIVDDNTGSYGSSVYFRTYTADDYQSLYGVSTSTNLDPLNPTSYYGNRTSAKNQVIFGFPSFDYTVTVSADPNYAGSVTGGGIFASGQLCLVSATANEGYCFYNWTENDEVVSTDAHYSFTVTDNHNMVAHFGLPVTITASANPETGGTVSGGGLYAPGHVCNLMATPNDGYTFISWTKDDEVVSYLSSYTFIVEGSADYVANFAQISSCIAIGDAFGATPYLPSNSYYNYSVSQQIYTAAEMGGANEISSIAFFDAGSTKTRNLTIYLKHTSKAAFNSDSDWITVNNSNKVFSGNVTFTSGNWTYIIFTQPFAYNGTSNLVLTVDDNTNDYSYGMNCRVFVANGNQALQAFSDDVNYNPKSPSSYSGSLMTLKNQVIFGLSGNIFNVFATADPTVGGTVSGGGVYQGGSTCTLTATPANGYHFFYWKENNAVASMANPYEFTVESDRNLTAHFEQVTNHWTTDGSAYSDNMALTGVVQINGVEQRSDLLEVAAFCGTECRGTQLLTYFAPTDRYLLWMTVYGQNGDALTFKVYDHRLAQELDMTSPNLTFNTNGYGTPINPYILDFTSAVTIDQPLTSGWNWWSAYIEMNGIDGLGMLEDGLGNNGIEIWSNNFSTEYDQEWGWFGDEFEITNEEMYMIQTNAACTVQLQGLLTQPESHPITINKGWNWIGYPYNQSMSVNDALSGFTPQANDQIKSRNGYATYISIGQYHYWDGTLNTLEPAQGYMYQSNSTAQKTLVYQTNRTMEPLPNITPEGNFHTPQSAAYANNMTITSVIELDGQELRADNYELAAFVGDECRGSVKLMYVEPFDRYVAFLTVFGEASEEMRFVLTNGRAASKSADHLDYVKNATVGTLTEPAVLHFGTLGVNDLDGKGWMTVYPNPIDRNATFSLVIPDDETIVETMVVNALGEVVDYKTGHIATSRMTGLPTSGIYTVKVVCRSGNTYIGKLVVK